MSGPPNDRAGGWRPERPSWRPFSLVVSWLAAGVAFMVAAGILPGVWIDGFWGALLVAAVVAVLNAVIPPVLAALRLPATLVLGFLLVLFADAGILVESDGNRIGGTAAAARNVISGNDGRGVNFGSSGSDNVVLGNYIGTDPAGTAAVPNTAAGVLLGNVGPQTVGGAESGAGNVISGNGGDGIFVSCTGSNGSVIQGNTIGLTAAGATARPSITGSRRGTSVYG